MKTTKTPRLGKMESRAREFCRTARENGSITINVEWRKSSCYGHCPAVMHYGEKIAYASGCGYNKISAVLAEALSYLLPGYEETGGGMGSCSGAGISTVQRKLAENGWTLEQVASGDTFDAFTLRRA